MAGVHIAQAAIGGTLLGVSDLRVQQPAVVAEAPVLHLQVKLGVGVDGVLEIAVFGAGLLHDDAPVFFGNDRLNQLGAFGAERLRDFRKPFRDRLDGGSGVSGLRLMNYELLSFRWRKGLGAHAKPP